MPTEHAPTAVYFLSDYGTADEFVGVVHAVLHRLAPGVEVIDLSHQIPPFDIAAGASLLARSAPHLGPGVVLAVVDPGVGSARRAVAVGTWPASGGRGAEDGTAGNGTAGTGTAVREGTGTGAFGGPVWLVGPDNGLLLPAADVLGGPVRVIEITHVPGGGPPVPPAAGGPGRHRPGATFDGRDVFAPAAAYLARGGDPARLGNECDPGTLTEAVLGGGLPDGAAPDRPGGPLVASVGWVDRFGNVQLRLTPVELVGWGLAPGGTASVDVQSAPTGTGTGTVAGADQDGVDRGTRGPLPARWVDAFADLAPGELGLLTDANGSIALVLDRASAARLLGVARTGVRIELSADRDVDAGGAG